MSIVFCGALSCGDDEPPELPLPVPPNLGHASGAPSPAPTSGVDAWPAPPDPPFPPDAPDATAPRSAPDLDERQPLELSAFHVADEAGFGHPSLTVRAKALVVQDLDSANYVQAKALCRVGTRTLADTGYINADPAHALGDLHPGDVASLSGSLFTQGLEPEHGPCQFEFRLAAGASAASVPLGEICWSEGMVREGRCVPSIAATPPPHGGPPLLVHDLGIREAQGFAAQGSLQADYVIEVREPPDSSSRLTLKAVCLVGETRFAAVRTATLTAGPFRFESGESLYRSANLFYDPVYEFESPPQQCELEVALWRRAGGRTGQDEKVELARACYRRPATTPGRCEQAATTASIAAQEALKLGRVVIEVVEPFGSKGQRYHLKLTADATVLEPVDPFTSLTASVTCKVGKAAIVDTAYLNGVDLFYLEAQETARLSSTAFTSGMEDVPHNCEVTFVAGRRFAPMDAAQVELEHYCLRRGKTSVGKC